MFFNLIVVVLFLFHIDHSQSYNIYLTTGWTITNANESTYFANCLISPRFYTYQRLSNVGIHLVNQTIPSGVYSALENAGITPSVFDGYNDINLRWIAHDNWTYKIRFPG